MQDSLYQSFDWQLLDDPKFKEDSVREELIVPLLTRLGYTASGSAKIHRSLAVKHPFVYLGSRSHRLELIPDYLFQVFDRYRWVLDAKAPSESTTKGKNPQQAYSYAIHPEIRVRYFALCNGRRFTIFDIHKLVPDLDIGMREIVTHWSALTRLIGAESFADTRPDTMSPDLGLHFYRLGMGSFESILFPLIPIQLIARISPDTLTISGGFTVGDESFCGSFDFHISLLPKLLDCVLPATKDLIARKLAAPPFVVDLRAVMPFVTMRCQLAGRVEHTHDLREDFCPMKVLEFKKP